MLDVVEEKPVFTAEVSVTGDGFNGGSTFAVAVVSDQLITGLTIRG